MSNEIKDGGPAFPFSGEVPNLCVDSEGNLTGGTYGTSHVCRPGMTLRDYFAGQALAGMIGDSSHEGSYEHFAFHSYLYADAMLAAREGKP